jgi:hypothetical protein
MRVEETLTFDETTWEGRVDLRDMSIKELHWDSKKNPSEVKAVLDLREATIGRATFKEVRFQDVVDFSRTNFGRFKVDLMKFVENIRELTDIDFDPVTRLVTVTETSPYVLLNNNTFEKEADFLHVTFSGPTLLIDNRFRSTLDLTDASSTPEASLCLSFNRISRFKLELEHLGSPRSASPYELLIDKPLRSLFTDPLSTSKVRQIVEPASKRRCEFIYKTKGNIQKDNNDNRHVEYLDAIYKTLGQAFKEAKDQGGVNEAWYLQKVVEQNQQRIDSPISYWLSRVLLDIPSRYTVDVWRTVWVSIMIMLVFSVVYWLVLRRLVRSDDPDAHQLQVPAYPARQRAFRIRLFEPIRILQKATSQQETHDERAPRFPCQILRASNVPGCSMRAKSNQEPKDAQDVRDIIPWRDAPALSFRAFTKIGLGTAYPNTGKLTALTLLIWLEWGLGVYMLIHFILAVKNNLPFIAPFLGVVN